MKHPHVLILQHSDTTTPGNVPDLLTVAGATSTIGQLHRGFDLGRAPAFDAVVLLGGGVHVDQEDKFPFLGPEKAFITKVINEGVPVMGLCLGAQLIADVMGAACQPHPRGWELGWYDVECLADPELKGFEMAAVRRVSQYHRYTFGCPPGARVIARNAWCDVQAFAYKTHVLAFGFHPERTPLANLEITREADLPTEGQCQTPAEMLELGRECEPKIRAWFATVLEGWLSPR